MRSMCIILRFHLVKLQIISFLQQNAHPRVAERIPSVPENVTDQVRMCDDDVFEYIRKARVSLSLFQFLLRIGNL